MSEKDVFEFSKHNAIHTVEFNTDAIVIIADTDQTVIADGIVDAAKTIKETFTYCLSVIDKRSNFMIYSKRIKLILNKKEVAV